MTYSKCLIETAAMPKIFFIHTLVDILSATELSQNVGFVNWDIASFSSQETDKVRSFYLKQWEK